MLQTLSAVIAQLSHENTTPQQVAAGGAANTTAAASSIGNLTNTTISNPTITGGSITASSISGTISNAINATLGTITSLGGTELTYTRATFDAATTTNLYATNASIVTASTTNLTVNGTSTVAGLNLRGINCSPFGNGGKLTTDAFGNVYCSDDYGSAGGAGSPGGINTQIQFNDSGSFAGNANVTFNKSTNVFTVTNASTTNLTANYASSTKLFAGTLALTNQLTVANGGTGATSLTGLVKGNGTSAFTAAVAGVDYENPLTFGSGLTRSTNSVTLDASGNWSGTLGGYTASQLIAAGFSTTSADAWKTNRNFFATSSADYWKTQNNFFATTSAAYWDSQQSRWATTSTDYWFAQKTTDSLLQGSTNKYYSSLLFASDLAGTTTDALHEGSTNQYFTNARADTRVAADLAATTTTALAEGSNLYFTNARAVSALTGQNISQFTNDAGYFATTSANYWKTQTTFTGASTTLLANNNTFSGTNTFTNPIAGSITGNAGTVTNGIYSTDTNTVTNTMLAGSIANAKLSHSTIVLNGQTLTLGDSGDTITAASSTALGDANTWTGVNKFTNAGSDFSGTWQTYSPSHFFDVASWYATTSAPQLTTLANLATVGTITSGTWHGTAVGDTYISSASNWNTAYTNRITSATYPLSISSNVLSSATSSATSAGVLSAADWTTFNNKQPAGSYITGNQTVTLSGAVSGSGATSITTSYAGTLGNTLGGTGANSSAWTGLAGISGGAWYPIATSSALYTSITGNAGTVTGGVYTTDTGTVSNTMLAGSIANAKLANSTIKLNNTTLTLGDTGDTITAASSTLLSDNNTFTGKLVFGNATSTNFFSTTASSTNLFAQTAALGTLTLGNVLTVASGGTGASTFGQGWVYSSGGTNALAASTSPTVN